ncbi:conjugal transfer relaxosome DNA-binding protein TraM [Klebsiella quasipneumoniae]|uniref:conjugal transfer relaxosome DNA-binding protein TraM n=1 Tax=Klebsiella quasipneumoniae TaxID=1463165 RepID=UPI00220D4C46|nr:conjugal transfer relaxosome DNA-binding protein TraM [Klebsiella quasipneumoniae]BDO06187.1 conjugal transfer protein TraM [Klebsiella quasipneumoniae subsp. quasipneumoniae]
MAKIQVYVNDNVAEKINAIAVQRRAEGAKEKDISYSSIASMLLELGLRVYEAQMERKESGFNQMAFNRALLESMVKTQFTVNKVLGIECLSPHVNGNPKWEWSGLIENIRDDVSAVMENSIRFYVT